MSSNQGFTPDPEMRRVIEQGSREAGKVPGQIQRPPPPKVNIQDVLEHGVGDQFGLSFKENNIRNQFVRKVYSIIAMELTLITIIVAIFQATAKHDILVVHRHEWFIALIAMLVVFVVSSLVLTCGGDKIRRSFPTNMIVLTFNMVIIGVMLGIVCCLYDVISVLIAAGITLVLVGSITLFAFSTKIDFTKYWIYAVAGSLVLTMSSIGILAVYLAVDDFNYRNYYMMRTGFAGLGALVMSFVLIFDTQWIILGKHKYSCSPEDHVIAAFIILNDIITIFLYILRIFGIRASN